ncbi:hypothetical protein H6G06_25170 [Anabaena sphaerica FACHB-251]|uniref:Uncharacterized protein n=1 Tax=Anabaena sphaerica FACHB-251 TaxID=2692883 RepID=A0A926WP25_9NOST|nr:hypothetical protein [Anabaena sphaerica]MBD2296683.1 hypothetical protein [Anabaena sphaerica FACHB-251]
MSKLMIKSQPLVDLSTVEQQLFAGGQSNPMELGNMPNVLGNGFPNVAGANNPFGSTKTSNTDEKIQAYNNNVGTILY